MTISSTTRKTAMNLGNGVTTSFAFTFKVQSSADIAVFKLVSDVETEVSTSDYTVTLNSNQNTNPGGTVDFTTAPASTQSFIITTDADATQEQNIQNQAAFNPSIVMEALDKLTIQAQQLRQKLLRSISMPITDGFDGELPTASSRAGKVLGFDTVTGAPTPYTLANLVVDVALADLWPTALVQTVDKLGPVSATLYGFTTGTGSGAATANTTALQTALNNHYWVSIPAGIAYVNQIIHTRVNRLSGQGRYSSKLILPNTTNTRMFKAVSLSDMVYEGFAIDMNFANNVGSGAHDAIRLETCTNPVLRDLYITGAQGLFSGSPVGGGVSLSGGSGISLKRVKIDLCFDGLQATTHPYGSDEDCEFITNRRFGFLITTGSDYWQTKNLKCNGNSTTDASGHNYSFSDSDYVTVDTLDANNAVLGSGFLCYTSDYFTGYNIRTSNNGLDGCGPYGSLYFKLDGLISNNNAVRGLTVDSLSHYATVSKMTATGNGDKDVSIFRSSDFHGTDLNFLTGRVHEATDAQSMAIATAGAGYTNGTFLCSVQGGTVGPLGRATFNVTVAGGIVTAVSAVVSAGEHWTLPTNPVTVSGLSAGAGATFNVTWSGANQGTAARCTFRGGGQGATLILAKDPSGGIGATNNAIFEGFRGTVTDEDSASVLYANACPLVPCVVKTASLQNSWVVDTRCVYYKDSDGLVHLEGRIKNGTVAANTIIFTLPAGYRPANVERFFVNANGALGQCYIGTDGTVRDLGGSFSAGITGLNGIFFRAA